MEYPSVTIASELTGLNYKPQTLIFSKFEPSPSTMTANWCLCHITLHPGVLQSQSIVLLYKGQPIRSVKQMATIHQILIPLKMKRSVDIKLEFRQLLYALYGILWNFSGYDFCALTNTFAAHLCSYFVVWHSIMYLLVYYTCLSPKPVILRVSIVLSRLKKILGGWEVAVVWQLSLDIGHHSYSLKGFTCHLVLHLHLRLVNYSMPLTG